MWKITKAISKTKLFMWAVIPVKKVDDAKYRLKSVLKSDQRKNLFIAMLEDVLSTVTNITELEEVSLATICPIASKIARKYDATILSTLKDEGQTEAIKKAATIIENQGSKTILMLPADIPLATVSEIRTVIKIHENSPMITIVPAKDNLGSNCIALSPPTAMPLNFGQNSYFPHIEKARNLGIKIYSALLPGISLDIDTPEDLKKLCQKPIRTHAQKYLFNQKIM